MASLAELHDALADRLATISGLQVFAYPPQGVTPPVAFPELSGWQPIAMGRKGRKTYTFTVRVFTAQALRPQDGYRVLMEFADSSGARSIDVAIWDGNDAAAGTFAGVADTSAFVSGFQVLGQDQIDAFEAYGGEFTVTVETKGS